MRKAVTFILIVVVILHSRAYSQFAFTSTINTKTDLASVTNYNGCASPGTTVASFNVSGLPSTSLSASFAVAEIRVSFDATCGGDFYNTKLVLRWSDGTNTRCFYFFEGFFIKDATWDATGTSIYQSVPDNMPVYLRDTVTCTRLRFPNFDQEGYLYSRTTTSNNGYYRAGCYTCGATQPSTATLADAFSGINPNTGTWTIHALYDNTGTNAPCINSANIVFSNPEPLDLTGAGNDCSSAIQYDGTPFCASTGGKTGSTQMPGSLSGPNTNSFGTIGGVTCDWNNANNNDVWIKLTPGAGYSCISISGLEDGLQSIVVEAANADNDNDNCTANAARTATDDPNWKVVSCPSLSPSNCDTKDNCSSGIYSGIQGTIYNQQHCFITEQGKSYYLVVDGNGGAVSRFYISGLKGPSAATLSNNILDFSGDSKPEGNFLKWQYRFNAEKVIAYELQRSFNGRQFDLLSHLVLKSLEVVGKEYNYLDTYPFAENNYYRLKVLYRDGSSIYSSVVRLKGRKNTVATIYPNPVMDVLNVYAANQIAKIDVYNWQGQFVYSNATLRAQQVKIPAQSWAKGRYIVFVTDVNGNTESLSFTR